MNHTLSAISIGNFKAFSKTQRIPIKPITLVFGPNSSGKSSIIHSLAFAHEVITGEKKLGFSRFEIYRTGVGGDSIDLGGFRQYVYQHQFSKKVEWGVDLSTSKMEGSSSKLFSSVKTVSISVLMGIGLDSFGSPIGEVGVESIDIYGDGIELLHLSQRGSIKQVKTFRIDRLNVEHPVFRHAFMSRFKFTTQLDEEEFAKEMDVIYRVIGNLLPQLQVKVDGLFPTKVSAINFKKTMGSFKENLDGSLVRKIKLPSMLNFLIKEISALLSNELSNLEYLGPLRSFPPRHLANSGYEDRNWKSGGGFAWNVLFHDDKVRNVVNVWLGADKLKTPYKLVKKTYISLEDVRKSDKSKILKYRDSMEELVLMDQRTKTEVTHRDVGIGLSQVLPVLVLSYASRGKLIAMEQPEIHLHPALQAELGDLFIESALGNQKNTFILETHSEHLILRLLRRIRETSEGELPEGSTPVRTEDVCVIYVQPEKEGSKAIEVKITPDGDFATPWPDGFFPERGRELFE